jgi:hypothetical protein
MGPAPLSGQSRRNGLVDSGSQSLDLGLAYIPSAIPFA